MSATQAILDFAAAPHVLPPEVAADAKRLLADTLACGIAGSTAPGADGVLASAKVWGTGDDCRVLGRASHRLPAPAAAFVNGFQIHCLEWDAVHEPAVVHAMSVVTAALLAVIDRRGGCDPDEALTALAVGVDIASGLGISATSGLKFFRPATAGVIGAALACARIDGLPHDRFADVMGLAYSQAAGTMQAHVEGSIALPLQVAAAARAAVTALDLVTYDLTGPHNVLEGPFGYFRLIDDGSPAAYARDLGQVWRIAEISTKPYPSGRASHAVLSTLQRLQAEHRFAADDVASIDARVPVLIHRLVGRPWVDGMSAAYARLCLPFLAALMLTDGRVDPRKFTSAAFADPALREIGAKLAVTVDANPDPNALGPQSLSVRLQQTPLIPREVEGRTDRATRSSTSRGMSGNGRTLELHIPATLGAPNNALSPAETAAKLTFCEELAAEPQADRRLFDDPAAFLASEAR